MFDDFDTQPDPESQYGDIAKFFTLFSVPSQHPASDRVRVSVSIEGTVVGEITLPPGVTTVTVQCVPTDTAHQVRFDWKEYPFDLEEPRAGDFDELPGEAAVDAEFARLLGRCPDCGSSLTPNARLTHLRCECGYRYEAP